MDYPQRLVSTSYPFLSIRFEVRGQRGEGLALLDTGFDGDLVIPNFWLARRLGFADGRSSWELADDSVIDAPVYLGVLEIVGLASIPDMAITILGNEYILGRGILDLFEVTFDHGQRVIVRP